MSAANQTEAVAVLESAMDTMIGDMNESLDTIWMLVCAMLVFLHAGFSLLEAGTERVKNTQNILAKNLMVVTVGFLCWYVVGYPVALGPGVDANRFAGSKGSLMDGFWEAKSTFRVWFFQGCFCATGATIVSGAIAERARLDGFTMYTVLMTCAIYPVVIYWGWSGSGIFNYAENGAQKSLVGPPLMDFAGSGLVHLVGGIGAFCGTLLVGTGVGRWEAEEDFEAHSIPFCVVGTFFLWFGWYGFNPGSTLQMHTASDGFTASLVAVNTTLAPCCSALMVFTLRALVVMPRKLDVGGMCNGILAGLVSITGPCAFVKPFEAIIIGLLGGAIYQCASTMMRRAKLDDVVDAFAVHGACGMWGLVAAGLFGDPAEGLGGNGFFYSGNQLQTQMFAALLIILWVGGLSSIAFFALGRVGMLRLSDDIQKEGADAAEHAPKKAYSFLALAEDDAIRPFSTQAKSFGTQMMTSVVVVAKAQR